MGKLKKNFILTDGVISFVKTGLLNLLLRLEIASCLTSAWLFLVSWLVLSLNNVIQTLNSVSWRLSCFHWQSEKIPSSDRVHFTNIYWAPASWISFTMKRYMEEDVHGINHQPYFQEAHSPVVNIFRACLGSVDVCLPEWVSMLRDVYFLVSISSRSLTNPMFQFSFNLP